MRTQIFVMNLILAWQNQHSTFHYNCMIHAFSVQNYFVKLMLKFIWNTCMGCTCVLCYGSCHALCVVLSVSVSVRQGVYCNNYTSLAFNPPTPSSSMVYLGSDLILYCPIILYSPVSMWSSDGSEIFVNNSNETENSFSYDIVFNQTTGAFSDLVITNAQLELDNTIISCGNVGTNIVYYVEIIVEGKYLHM